MARLKTLANRIGTAPARLVTVQPGSWRTSDMTSSQRGYGSKWQKAREGWLAKHPYCVYCVRDLGIIAPTIEGVILECAERRLPVPYASVVDHRVAHRGDMGLFWDRSNWQSMCAPHHSSEKQREEAAS